MHTAGALQGSATLVALVAILTLGHLANATTSTTSSASMPSSSAATSTAQSLESSGVQQSTAGATLGPGHQQAVPGHPDPESLPPDTFRKLAQALYQRTENRLLHRKFFYNRQVTCNDGSVAGYYIRRNYQSRRWIIFLEGGWICHDKASCESRNARERFRMSSESWPPVKPAGGILSSDPEENPHLHDANHVFVPYCSSDSWAGTRAHGGGGGGGGQQAWPKMAFMGSYIVQEVVAELSAHSQLLHADELFLAGSSAGAVGALVNVDLVAEALGGTGVSVRGIIDSGWFLDNVPFDDGTAEALCKADKGACSPIIEDLKKGIQHWGARVPDACAANYPDVWQCFIGYKALAFVKSPIFVFQWQFDKFQLYADNVAAPASPNQWDFIHRMGSNLRATFNDLSAVFSPACIAHEVITSPDWGAVSVDGVSLPDALECWASSLPPSTSNFNEPGAHKYVYVQGGQDRGAPSGRRRDFVTTHEFNTAVLHQSQREFSMLADAPKPSYDYKLARNLVRSIATPHDGDHRHLQQAGAAVSDDAQRNSISTRVLRGGRSGIGGLDDGDVHHGDVHGGGGGGGGIMSRRRRLRGHKRLLHHALESNQAPSEPFAGTGSLLSFEVMEDLARGGSGAGGAWIRRRLRKRQQRLAGRCHTEGDQDACRKLQELLARHPVEGAPRAGLEGGVLSGGSDLGLGLGGTFRLRHNSDLIRSLDSGDGSKVGDLEADGGESDVVRQERRRRRKSLRRAAARRRRQMKRKKARRQRRRQQKRLERKMLREKKKQMEASKASKASKANKANRSSDSSKATEASKGSEASKASGEGHRVSVRSLPDDDAINQPDKVVGTSSCRQRRRTKLVDECSWPHCNRSCPKLKNPETGQEIEFISLLQSFGLNIGSVAKALGVDVMALKNMDNDVLLRLLTSQRSPPAARPPGL